MEQLSIFDLGMENINTEKTSEEIIRAKDLKVLQIESYVYTLDKLWYYGNGKWHVVSSTIALLEGNMVYFKDFFTYDFLYTFKTYKETYKFFYENLEKIKTTDVSENCIKTRVNIHNEFEDMYFCEKNRYSCHEYWYNNFSDEGSIQKRYLHGNK